MKERRFDFGWSRAAYAGPWIFAAVLIGAALGLQLARPDLWSAWFAVALVAVNSFVGGLILRASDRADHASLPLVDLLGSDDDLVLDAGCGAGRTTLSIAKVRLGKATHPLPYGRSVSSLIHARTAARRAAWSGMPSAFARLSRCFHTLAGKRTERGTVGPVSLPFRGLPRPAWMEIPPAAMRSAYGLRRTLALSRFTSGISRSDARDGSRGFLPVAFFIGASSHAM